MSSDYFRTGDVQTSRSGEMVGGERKKRRVDISVGANVWAKNTDAAQVIQPDNEMVALTKQARDGSEAAFATIFERFQTPIVNYIYRLVGDWDVANDLAQDTFLKAYTALPRTGDTLQISPWLYRIATNTALDSLRRRKRISWLPFGPEVENAVRQTDSSSRQAESDAIQQALAQVPPDQRVCLVLNLYQGLSYKEIADALNISANLVAVRIFRGREKFIEAYKKANPTE